MKAAGCLVKMAHAVEIGLAPAHDAHLGKQARLRERIGVDELLCRVAGVGIDDIDAATGVRAIVVELGAAGQQQRLAGFQVFQVAGAGGLAHVLVIGLVDGFDQVRHGSPPVSGTLAAGESQAICAPHSSSAAM
ncbi:hypothetical protein AU476_22830 [Cupriavidus sp. UYMSc13B]|nr:hypothetical protein AU476_22830 [Cupriavidus sp. UYMSc13B]